MYVLRCYLCATTSDVVVIIEVYLLVLLMLSIAYVECSDRRHAGGLLISFQLYVYLYEELCFLLYLLTTTAITTQSGLSVV